MQLSRLLLQFKGYRHRLQPSVPIGAETHHHSAFYVLECHLSPLHVAPCHRHPFHLRGLAQVEHLARRHGHPHLLPADGERTCQRVAIHPCHIHIHRIAERGVHFSEFLPYGRLQFLVQSVTLSVHLGSCAIELKSRTYRLLLIHVVRIAVLVQHEVPVMRHVGIPPKRHVVASARQPHGTENVGQSVRQFTAVTRHPVH